MSERNNMEKLSEEDEQAIAGDVAESRKNSTTFIGWARWRLHAIRLWEDRAALRAEIEAMKPVVEAAQKMNDFLLSCNTRDFNVPDEIYLPWKKALVALEALNANTNKAEKP